MAAARPEAGDLLRQEGADRMTVGIGGRSFLAQTAIFAGGSVHGSADIGNRGSGASG